jgi:hypothetical protein
MKASSPPRTSCHNITPSCPRCQSVPGNRAIGASEATGHRWRKVLGRLKLDQVKRLKEVELKNSRLQNSRI